MSELRVAVIGAGAVGSYFGGMLARGGTPVTLIARAAHVEPIRRDGLWIERVIGGTERIPIAATTELAAVADANVALLCVKTPDTEEVAGAVRRHLAPDALVLSLQNGVDNVDRIWAAAQFDSCGVPCRIVADIRPDLWMKMIMNCAYNRLSAIGRVQYGALTATPYNRMLHALVKLLERA